MTPTPATGDIWQYNRYTHLEPVTVILGEVMPPMMGDDDDFIRFKVVPLDFPDLKEITFRPSDSKYWRKLA